ncbi:hypothetical protein [Pseudomonas fragi]|uniref:hypothetical protein n=1 Tax=Pseudomonas fragi TaxID=296 RepID=UPI00200616C5|nr:hypothetical protein [Pseudomonas fragi]MCK6252580.1 hypothetical protein [Pseudomonas fragi]
MTLQVSTRPCPVDQSGHVATASGETTAPNMEAIIKKTLIPFIDLFPYKFENSTSPNTNESLLKEPAALGGVEKSLKKHNFIRQC